MHRRSVEEKEAVSCLFHRHLEGFPPTQEAGEGPDWEDGGGGRVKAPLLLTNFLDHGSRITHHRVNSLRSKPWSSLPELIVSQAQGNAHREEKQVRMSQRQCT